MSTQIVTRKKKFVLSMSDDEIIKRRLLIDGDGTGEDRRYNLLLKAFLKWCYNKKDTKENNQIFYDRILAQIAQTQFALKKNEYTFKMIEEELQNYGKLSDKIRENIECAKTEIEESKNELILAKQIRKNKMEYDLLAKIINEQPDRKETQAKINALQKECNELIAKRERLEQRFVRRQNDFELLMLSIRELEASLNEEKHEILMDNKEPKLELKIDKMEIDMTPPMRNDFIMDLSDGDDDVLSVKSNEKRDMSMDVLELSFNGEQDNKEDTISN